MWIEMNQPLITLFTSPKPFTDAHINTIQRNAILSWTKLGDRAEIFLMGDDEGVDEVAREYGCKHFPDVRCNEKGTPLISSMLDIARANSTSLFLCIINTDIIVLPEMLDAVVAVSQKLQQFLMVGQRWDVAINTIIPTHGFYEHVRKNIQDIGRLHPPMGSDYFIFPRTCYTNIPDFAIGRAGWDNWMIYKARLEGWKVVDASSDILIAHQDHDYSHLKDGKPHYRQPETKVNVKLAGGEHTIFTLHDAQRKLQSGMFKTLPCSWKRFWREVEIFPTTTLKNQALARFSYFLFNPRKAYIAFRQWLNEMRKRK